MCKKTYFQAYPHGKNAHTPICLHNRADGCIITVNSTAVAERPDEVNMARNADGKIVVITGASAGIGAATAALFARRGAKVVALNRRQTPDFECIGTDVTDAQAVNAAVAEVVRRYGRIDVLVCNAGMGISGAAESTPEEAVRKIFELNFFGLLNTVRAVVPHMREAGGGTVVTVSSVAAELSIPFQAFYSATKAAVSSLTDALRIELAPFGIKVTSVLPGDVKTDFTASREKNAADDPAYGDRVARSVAVMERDERNGMPPSVIAEDIYRLATMKNPPPRKIGGVKYKVLVAVARALPRRAVSRILGKLYG